MEEYKQITLDEWTRWKEDIRQKLAETANNFVYIGYRLKQIRDSGIYGGAADIFEFAQNEYGLGRSTVSRFIAINERYSENGDSLELKEEFRNFSSSKLSEMLTLPDKEIELINERTTIRAIRELKKFDAADPDEVQAQEAEQQEEKARTPLEKCIIDFFRSRKEELNTVMQLLEQEEPEYKAAAEVMVPAGQTFHKKGIVFLFLYEWNDGVKYKLMTSPEPVSMSWTEFLNIIYGIYSMCEPRNAWDDFYGKADEPSEEIDEKKAEEIVEEVSDEPVEEMTRESEKKQDGDQEEEPAEKQEKHQKGNQESRSEKTSQKPQKKGPGIATEEPKNEEEKMCDVAHKELDLKACPFCGGTASLSLPAGQYKEFAMYQIRCADCGANVEGKDPGLAAEKWNRRV